MNNTFKDKWNVLVFVAVTQLYRTATLVQRHYVVDHPKVGEWLI